MPMKRLFDPEEVGISLIRNISTLYQTARGHIHEYRNFDTAGRTLNLTNNGCLKTKNSVIFISYHLSYHSVKLQKFRIKLYGKWRSTNPDIAPLFARGSLWRYIEGGDKPNYCIKENFCSQTFTGPK
jgi:hypothetical protein